MVMGGRPKDVVFIPKPEAIKMLCTRRGYRSQVSLSLQALVGAVEWLVSDVDRCCCCCADRKVAGECGVDALVRTRKAVYTSGLD